MPVFPRRRRAGLVQAMGGVNPAFQPPQDIFSAQQGPVLPENYGFNDLAGYEEQRRRELGEQAQRSILDYRTQFAGEAAKRRAGLATSLTESGKRLFQEANPQILEDLNTRGFLSSPTEVARSQAQALKEIDLASQSRLQDFDTQTFGQEEALRQAGLSADLQARQDALDAGLDLRRGQLESQQQSAQAAQEDALARKLAKEQRRGGITQSLIGAGGSLAGGLLAARAFGGGVGKTAIVGGKTVPVAGAGGGGIGGALLPLAGVGAGLGLYEEGRKLLRKQGFGKNTSKALSAVPGVGLSVGVANKAVKSIKKAFCFNGSTSILMADGSQKMIDDIELGDETRGGTVQSVRISLVDKEDIFDYEGIKVTKYHAVNEDGKWIRVKDSSRVKPAMESDNAVYSIVTSGHRIYANNILFADEHETEFYEALNMEESLIELNRQGDIIEVPANGQRE